MAKSEFKDRLKKTEEVEVTVTGRVSRDKSSPPVWFVEEVGKLYLLPLKGSDTEWYKNVLKKPEITLNADGQTVKGESDSDHQSRQSGRDRREVSRQVRRQQREEVLYEI
jgi:hypothetical protein